MKIAAAKADTFVRSPDPSIAVVLIYGPDAGLVRERVTGLIGTLAGQPPDPFLYAELDGGTIRKDAAALTDEAAAISPTGQRRVIVVRDGTDAATTAVEAILDRATTGGLTAIAANELGPRSSLRRCCEAHRRAAAIACYADDERTLPGLVRESLAGSGLTIDGDALAAFVASLGGDRGVTRRELEKLALYKGDTGCVTVDDVMACVGDNAADSLDDVAFAAAGTDSLALDATVNRSLQAGISPVALLRATARHMQRLQLAKGLIAGGKSVEDAAKALRPPVFYKRLGQFKSQLTLWPIHRTMAALDVLTEAELGCKSTGAPDHAICAQALAELARLPRRPGP